jgi:hypothetical protein
MDDNDERLIVGYAPLASFLTNAGFPISKSTVSKYGSPAINIGPPIEGYWGRLPAFKPSQAIDWAKARLKPVSAARSTWNRTRRARKPQ